MPWSSHDWAPPAKYFLFICFVIFIFSQNIYELASHFLKIELSLIHCLKKLNDFSSAQYWPKIKCYRDEPNMLPGDIPVQAKQWKKYQKPSKVVADDLRVFDDNFAKPTGLQITWLSWALANRLVLRSYSRRLSDRLQQPLVVFDGFSSLFCLTGISSGSILGSSL